jgi:hypothetical protein
MNTPSDKKALARRYPLIPSVQVTDMSNRYMEAIDLQLWGATIHAWETPRDNFAMRHVMARLDTGKPLSDRISAESQELTLVHQ